MPVELRKRKAPAAPAAPAPPAKKASRAPAKANPVKAAATKVKEAVTGKKGKKAVNPKSDNKMDEKKPEEKKATNGSSAVAAAAAPAEPPKDKAAGKVAVGQTVNLAGFGGEVETHDGEKTTLKALVDASKGGVVVFTYPKASTPGCTNQVCFFRDSYDALTRTGFSIYGLSTDSPKANTNFHTKQHLPYPLLCDPKASLIEAIGMKKSAKSTTRGIFVVDKSGKVLAAEPGSPAETVNVVKKLVGPEEANGVPSAEEVAAKEAEEKKDDKEKADVAGEVADTAEKLDANAEEKKDGDTVMA